MDIFLEFSIKSVGIIRLKPVSTGLMYCIFVGKENSDDDNEVNIDDDLSGLARS
jgi:hypothetical protein